MILNDYTFNRESIKFLKQIEDDYSEKIEIIIRDLGVGNHGFSQVINGIPTIETNSEYLGNLESLIIHEAYHLRLIFDGCPNVSFHSSHDVLLTEQNKEYLNWFYHKSWDKITHHYFYPKIKKELEVNPYIDFENELRMYLDQGQIPDLNNATKKITLGCYYLQTWVETQNGALINEFETFLNEVYQGGGLEIGKALVFLFEQNPLNCIDDFNHLFIKAFNVCHEGHAQMKLKGTESEKMENYTQYYSIFSMWKA